MGLAFKIIDSPVGKLKLVASDNGLVAILWEDEEPERVRLGELTKRETHPILLRVERQLGRYFAGSKKSFSVPVDLRGTPFQISVWQALLTVPFGGKITYSDLAARLGNPRAARAVGTACGRNPISIVVPCHRVVGASGDLTGFAGGLEAKARLLDLEKRETKGK
jgi:methylated-DNA-[protein]-cysteine S-methyltransferase